MFGKQRVVGLDLGQTTTKVVVLEGTGPDARIARLAILRSREEGILSHEELGEQLGGWLEEQRCRREEFIVSIPQYLAIAQLSDFPPGAKQLDEMVAFETQHLAGLSDEAFIEGYCQLEPVLHYRNPVLIGVCREAAVRERLAAIQVAALNVVDLVMEGQALVRAYHQLVPLKDRRNELHLLLDLGAENTTMALTFDGQVTNVGSMLFGGDNFTQAVAKHLGIPEAEAEKTKLSSTLVAGHKNSPLTNAATEFAAEVKAQLDNWRGQNPDEKEAPKLAAVYLSGGAALLPGLDEFLAQAMGCPVRRLAVPSTDKDLPGELFVLAYGIALQMFPGTRHTPTMSLAPRDVKWTAQRRRRAPLLVLATLMLAMVAAASLTLAFMATEKERRQLAVQYAQLEECRTILEPLKKTTDAMKRDQELLQPFAARGNRNRVMVTALQLLTKCLAETDWLVMVADETSYRKGVETPAPPTPPPTAHGPLFVPAVGTPQASEKPRPTSEFVPWRVLYASGLTLPPSDASPLERVRQMVNALKTAPEGIFRGDPKTRQRAPR